MDGNIADAGAVAPPVHRHRPDRGGRPRHRHRAGRGPADRGPAVEPRAGRSARVQCLACDRARRQDRHPLPAFGDGAGQLYGIADDGRRGARSRLVEGHGRVRLGEPQPARGLCLWQGHVFGRQPLGAVVASADAAGRGLGAGAAGAGRRQTLGGAGDGMRSQARHSEAQAERAQPWLRRARGGRRQGHARQGARDQGARASGH